MEIDDYGVCSEVKYHVFLRIEVIESNSLFLKVLSPIELLGTGILYFIVDRLEIGI